MLQTALLFAYLTAPSGFADEPTAEDSVEEPATEDSVVEPNVEVEADVTMICRRAVGGAAGGSLAGTTWDFVGQGPIIYSGSFYVSATCDFVAHKLVSIQVGADTAPLYQVRTWEGRSRAQWATFSAGPTFKVHPIFELGVSGFLGFGVAGVGLRAHVKFLNNKKKQLAKGIEFRANLFLASTSPGLQLVLLWHFHQNKAVWNFK